MRDDTVGVPLDPTDVVWDVRLGQEISLYGRDRGTPERWAKSAGMGIVRAKRGDVGLMAVDREGSVFARYHSRCELAEVGSARRGEENEQRYGAGLRFLDDWERSARRPRTTSRLDGCVTTVGRGWMAIEGDWRLWADGYLAMDRWAGCVQDVVCFDVSATDWARARASRMPDWRRVGMMALRLGLVRLVRFYAAVDRGGWRGGRCVARRACPARGSAP